MVIAKKKRKVGRPAKFKKPEPKPLPEKIEPEKVEVPVQPEFDRLKGPKLNAPRKPKKILRLPRYK